MKVLVLAHPDLVPPDNAENLRTEGAEWQTEYDVIRSLKRLKHEVSTLGLLEDLELLRNEIDVFKPHIVFNLLEEFDGNPNYDQHVVSYLELKRIPYTGCNPRGLTLARDKALSKKILSYHRIPTPKFQVFPKNHRPRLKKELSFPIIIKSLTEEASLGISQASVVTDAKALNDRVHFIHKNLDTDAIAEQYIEGRELYVGLLGNTRIKPLPVWELDLSELPEDARKIATEKVKWNRNYRKKYSIQSRKAKGLDENSVKNLHVLCKKAYRALGLNGYARMDLRFTSDGNAYIIEANPNPGIARDEEFSSAAAYDGYSYDKMISKFLSLGINWYRGRK